MDTNFVKQPRADHVGRLRRIASSFGRLGGVQILDVLVAEALLPRTQWLRYAIGRLTRGWTVSAFHLSADPANPSLCDARTGSTLNLDLALLTSSPSRYIRRCVSCAGSGIGCATGCAANQLTSSSRR